MSDCSADSGGSCYAPHTSKVLSIAAIFVILVASAAGVFLPIYGRRLVKALVPGSNLYALCKSFSAGIILALAFTHVMNDAADKLLNPCLTGQWQKYPWPFWIASIGLALSLALELFTTQMHSWFKGGNSLLVLAEHDHADHARKDQRTSPEDAKTQSDSATVKAAVAEKDLEGGAEKPKVELGTSRQKIIAEVLEIGIIVHSILVGVGLGTSTSKCTVTSLFIALIFHQFFEGLALGSCITEAVYSNLANIVMGSCFAVTTPFGIALGLGIRASYNDNSTTALATEGVFNSFTAGILVYMGTVDLVAHDFFNTRLLSKPKLLWACFVALLCGMGVMDLLAYWA